MVARKTRWTVKAMDRLAQGLISAAGVGTILAISTVFVFLLWVVAPLFESPVAREAGGWSAEWLTPEQAPVFVSLEESQALGWAVTGDGILRVFRADNGQVLQTIPLAPEKKITAMSFSTQDEVGILGFEDGTVQVGKFGIESSLAEPRDLPEAIRKAAAEGPVEHENGLLVPMGEGTFRLHRFTWSLNDPVPVADHAPLELIDHAIRTNGLIFAALAGDGTLTVDSLAERKNLLTGKIKYTLAQGRLPYAPPEGKGKPAFLRISGLGDMVCVAWADGYTLRFDTRDLERPVLAEQLDLVEEADTSLTDPRFLIGRSTLLAGDSRGRTRAWFRARKATSLTSDGQHLVMAHEMAGGGAAVTSLSASRRGRVAAAGFADGSVRLYHVTSGRTLLEIPPDNRKKESASVWLAPKDDGVWVLAGGAARRWSLDLKYPEATWAALFRPVWYEGYEGPAHVWQSTGGTDDFEPKYGLVPLIFGTVKATFYSMFFALPLALLAAVYTSEFLHPRAKAVVKPVIELMASLPSVVLGFLAALVFAPLVESVLPAVLAALVTVPLAFVAGACAWNLLPASWSMYLSRRRFLFMLGLLPVGILAAAAMGPAAERWLFPAPGAAGPAGDIMAWLDGRTGTGFMGWMFLFTPLSAAAVFLMTVLWVNPWMRKTVWIRNRAGMAGLELVKCVLGGGVVLGLAYGCAFILTDLGFDPRGSFIGTYEQRNALVVGFVMGFAVIPLIYTLAEDALSSVPGHLRSASLACGATPWQTAARIVVPTAMSGLFSAVMIGVGRAAGETMIVLMAAGNTPVLSWNIFNGFRTLSANIAVEMPEAVRDSAHYRILFLAALALFGMTFLLNTAAELVRLRFRKKAVEL